MKWLTPPTIAADLGLSVDKVLAWIRSGALPAVNVANEGTTRPRWRVKRDDLDTFLAGRSNRLAAGSQTPQPRRRRLPARIREFV